MSKTFKDFFFGSETADTRTCPFCGVEVPKGQKHCQRCGHDMAATPAPEVEKVDTWDCVKCNLRGIKTNCCPNCGAKHPDPPKDWKCPNCGKDGILSEFCPDCGTEKPVEISYWDCKACDRKHIPQGDKHCPQCGRAKGAFRITVVKEWACPNCGKEKNKTPFCPDCGTEAPEEIEPEFWSCPVCKNEGLSSEFCPQCGTGKPWHCPTCGKEDCVTNCCPDCGTARP